MRGFFRILPVRAGDDLPDQCRLRVFRAAVLLYILFHLGTAQRKIITYFTTLPWPGKIWRPWDDLSWGKPFSLIFRAVCFFLIIELIERTEARQRQRCGSAVPFPEHREWGLLYVLPLAVLAILRLLQWLGVGMMLDWKTLPTQAEDVVFLFLSIPCINEVRKLMNRQRAYAAAGERGAASVALTTWILGIPLLYNWISQFVEFLYFQMIGCAIVGVLTNPLYSKYSTWINLYLSSMQYDMAWNPYLAFIPILWALLMIAKAGKYGIGLKGTPPQNRMEAGAAIFLAFIYPSLPRWILLRSELGPAAQLSSRQRLLIGILGLILAAILIDGAIVYKEDLRWGWNWLSFWHYDLKYFYHPIWIFGALYEFIRASNLVENEENSDSRDGGNRSAA